MQNKNNKTHRNNEIELDTSCSAGPLGLLAPPAGCISTHSTMVIMKVCSCLSQAVQQAQLLQAQPVRCHIKVWWLGATCLVSGGRRRCEPAWSLSAARRLWLSLQHCNNNTLLPQPGCAESTALAGTACTNMGMIYQGLQACGNLLGNWRSEEARAGLVTRRPRWLRLSLLQHCNDIMLLP